MPILNTLNSFALIQIILLLITVTKSYKIAKESPIDYNKATLYNSQVNIEAYLATSNPSETFLYNKGPEDIGDSQENEEVKVAIRKKNKIRSFHFKATGTPRTRNKKFVMLRLPFSDASDDYPISDHAVHDEFVTTPPTTTRYVGHTPQYAFNMYNPAYKRDPPISPKVETGYVVKSKRQHDTLEHHDRIPSQIRMAKHFVEGVANSEEESANNYKNLDVDVESFEVKDIIINASAAENIPLASAIRGSRPNVEAELQGEEMPSSYHVKDIFGKNMFINYYDIDFDDMKLLASTFENITALIEKQKPLEVVNETQRDSLSLVKKIDYPTANPNETINAKHINNTKISNAIKNQSNICFIESPDLKDSISSIDNKTTAADNNSTQLSVYRKLLIRNILNHHKDGISKKIKSLLEKLNEKSFEDENIKDESSKLVVFNETVEQKLSPRPKYPHSEPSRWNKRPLWKEFSFMGLYIHEPSHLYCDAAAISPHWLIASGMCLNKHIREHVTDTRSAYVAYCSPNWRHPGRVAYVKYSLQHPRFQPNDPSRSHLYNIGLIRVGHSMDKACTDWSAVQLMSYKFSTDKAGVTAQAIGWGLDRYSVKDGSRNLPAWPLLLYEGLVHSESCPGNTEYQKLKQLNGVTSNMYCLSLPTYLGDQRDPAHGSFLISSGKLFAVYLKEERKSWGDQSAVYTGIWRILPWITNMAQEPEDPDLVMLEV